RHARPSVGAIALARTDESDLGARTPRPDSGNSDLGRSGSRTPVFGGPRRPAPPPASPPNLVVASACSGSARCYLSGGCCDPPSPLGRTGSRLGQRASTASLILRALSLPRRAPPPLWETSRAANPKSRTRRSRKQILAWPGMSQVRVSIRSGTSILSERSNALVISRDSGSPARGGGRAARGRPPAGLRR